MRLFAHRPRLRNEYRGIESAGHRVRACRAGIATLGATPRSIFALDHHLFGRRDSFGRIQPFGTSLRAVHNRMTAIQSERILKLIKSLARGIVTTVDQPAIRCQQCGRTQVAITIPPIARASR